jgi:hypothetical protein
MAPGHTVEDYIQVLQVAIYEAAADFPIVLQGLHNLKQALRVIKKAALQLVKYFRSIHIANDTKMAIAIGGLVGLATLAFLAYNPGEAYDYSVSKVEAAAMAGKKEKKAKHRNAERVRCSDLSHNDTAVTSKKQPAISEEVVLGAGVEARVDEKATIFLKGLLNIKNEIMETRSNGLAFDVALAMPGNENGLRKRKTKLKGKGEAGAVSAEGESVKRGDSTCAADDVNGGEGSDDEDGEEEDAYSNPFDNPQVRD